MKASRALAAAIASHRPDRRKSPGLSPRASLAVTPTPPERVVEQASVATRAAVIAAARIIQLHWRRKYYRRAWRGIEAKWWQHAVSRRKQTPTFAATVIQRWWRLQIVICRQLAACRIQSVLRTFVTPQMQILVHAAKLIQSTFRCYANHRRFLFLSSQALRIQTYYRGFLARRSLTKELDHMRQAKSRWLFNMSRGMFQPLWTYRVGGAGLRGSALDPLDILNQGEGHLSEARSLRKAASQKDIASSIKRTPVFESRILQSAPGISRTKNLSKEDSHWRPFSRTSTFCPNKSSWRYRFELEPCTVSLCAWSASLDFCECVTNAIASHLAELFSSQTDSLSRRCRLPFERAAGERFPFLCWASSRFECILHFPLF